MAEPDTFPVPPIGDVVHAIGDKVREQVDKLRDVYRRKQRARLVQLGLVLLGAYLLSFNHDDER
jgi:hypothetical protein